MIKVDDFECRKITNPDYRRMLNPSCLQDRLDYLDYLIDFYFTAIIELGRYGFKDEFRAEISTTIQMMFTKAKMFRQLLNGFSHSDGSFQLNNITDHTVLFTILRAAYEQLFAFELVYVIPDTDDKRTILKNAYIVSGLKSRQKFFSKDSFERNKALFEQEQYIINDCMNDIRNTLLYKSLDENSKIALEKQVLKKCNYQIYFDKNNQLITYVGWNQVRTYCGLGTTAMNGLYTYFCNMAHPSYVSLLQFRDAYKDRTMQEIQETTIMQMSAILSVFVMDYMSRFKMIQQLYDKMDVESQYMVCMYWHAFKSDSISNN